jgi:hypothetical protein
MPMDAVLKLLPNNVPGAKLKHEIVDKNSVDSLRRWLATRGPRRTGAKRETVASNVERASGITDIMAFRQGI